ncbi:MAG: hypothetical protein GY937_05410 [bacterium]|nr:hypothetical protein [bacterium]
MPHPRPASHPYFALPRPLLFGHRGASGERPENTLPAFEHAVREGVAALETDVHLTRDGEVAVFHDALLERTTNGEGPIAELSLAELRELDAGYRFSADGGQSFPFRGKGIQVPTLRETFDAFPDLRINVELKGKTDDLIAATLDLVAPRCELTLLAAAEDDTMRALRTAVEKPSAERRPANRATPDRARARRPRKRARPTGGRGALRLRVGVPVSTPPTCLRDHEGPPARRPAGL